MAKSLKVCQDCISKVKASLMRNGYARQKDLAEELNMSLATVSKFLNGWPVSYLNFIEISDRLGFDWRELASFEEEEDSHQTLPLLDEQDEFIYVERPPIETICYKELLKPNALVRIKAPGLMGKTSLIVKTLKQFDLQAGYRTVYLNLHFADETDFSSLNQFLKWFCASVGQSLGLPNLLAEQWNEEFSTPKVNCTEYFERHLLPSENSALVLCLDEVDRVISHQKVASEFLGLLRAWHERAKTSRIWQRLRLVLSISTEVYIPLNINESPFNVGLPIELPKFTSAQVKNLAQLHGLDWTAAQVKQLMDMVGGHPYLVEQALSQLKNNLNMTLNNLLPTAATDAGVYRNHLRHLWCMLEKRLELIAALADVVNADGPVRLKSEQFAYQLVSMGIVCFTEGNAVVPRCNLYRQYFREHIAQYFHKRTSDDQDCTGDSK